MDAINMDFGILTHDIRTMTDQVMAEWDKSTHMPAGTASKFLDASQELNKYVSGCINAMQDVDMDKVREFMHKGDDVMGLPHGTVESCIRAIQAIAEMYEVTADHITAVSRDNPDYDHEQDEQVQAYLLTVSLLEPSARLENHILVAKEAAITQ